MPAQGGIGVPPLCPPMAAAWGHASEMRRGFGPTAWLLGEDVGGVAIGLTRLLAGAEAARGGAASLPHIADCIPCTPPDHVSFL